MIDSRTGEQVLAKALSTGGDFAEIFAEDSTNFSIMLFDRLVESATSNRVRGVGIRVYKGTNSVYAYTNDCSLQGLLRCAGDAAAAIGDLAHVANVSITPSILRNMHEIKLLPSGVAGAKKASRLAQVDAAARAVSPEIAQVRAGILEWEKNIQVLNSQGLSVQDARVHTRFIAQAIASNGSENQIGFEGPGAYKGFEFVEGLDLERIGKDVATSAITMLHARNCPAGVMPVVIDGGFGGVIFHEACGHALEATAVAKGNSVFSGKIGKKIAADCVSAVDDATLANEWGSINVDDEGVATQKKQLIEHGVLKNYMIDRLNGRRMGLPSNGSGRRQDYTYAPTSRMSNTYICAGNDDEDAMIKTMGDGLYAKKMGGGSVDPVTGEFNFSVGEGYLVKDGRIHEPVRGATLIGKGANILMDIDRVGKTMTMSQGYCGSSSGSIFVNVGQPMIRVKSMTVGGR